MVRTDDANVAKVNGNLRIPKGVIPISPVLPMQARTSPMGLVPLIVRRKIQMMLLLRHCTFGCTLHLFQDEYKVYYKENICPEMYGFKSWPEFFNSMPEHVELASSKGHKVVRGNPLGQYVTVNYLKKIFTSPIDIHEENPEHVQVQHVIPSDEQLQNGVNGGPEFFETFVQQLLGENIPNGVNGNVTNNVELLPESDSGLLNNGNINGTVSNEETKVPVEPLLSSVKNGDLVAATQFPAPVKRRNDMDRGKTTEDKCSSKPPLNRSGENVVIENPVPGLVEVTAGDASPGASAGSSRATFSKNLSTNTNVTPKAKTSGTSRKRTSTILEDFDEEIQIIHVDPKLEKRSRMENCQVKGIRVVSPTDPPLAREPSARVASPRVPPTSTPVSPADPSITSASVVTREQIEHCSTVSPLPAATAGENSELPENDLKPVVSPKSEPYTLAEIDKKVPVPQTTIRNNTDGQLTATTLNEVALTAEPIPSTSTHVLPLTRVLDANRVACERSNSFDYLSESTQRLAASLPKCQVTLTRLKITERTPSPSPDDTPSPSPRRRKYSGCSASSSSSSAARDSRGRDAVRCSSRLLEKSQTPTKQTPSPAKPRSGPKSKVKSKGKRRLPEGNGADDDWEPEGQMQVQEEEDPVKDVPFPTWYSSLDTSEKFENFMKYSAETLPSDSDAPGESSLCGPYFPPQCRISMDEVQLHVDLGKNADYLKYHLFSSLLPENLPRDGWEIRMNEEISFPIMNLESYQIAELDYTFEFEISQHGTSTSQLNVVTSYGNYADYFLWKRGPNCKCLGIMPTNGRGMAKSRQSAGISYEKFSNFQDGTATADIFDPGTTRDFENRAKCYFPEKVDVFVASGIAYPGMRSRPEDLALVQALLALKLVREGGIFILKIDTTNTDFFVGLIFYLGHCFSKITLEKPESALPGEKFLVCFWKRKDSEIVKITKFLEDCNEFRIQQSWEQSDASIQSIFGFDDCYGEFFSSIDLEFIHFIRMHNENISQKELNMNMEIENRYEHVAADPENTNSDKLDRELLINERMVSERNSLLFKWNLHNRDRITDPIVFNDLPPFVLNWVNKPVKTTRVSDLVREGNWMKTGCVEQWTFILSTKNNSRAIVFVKTEETKDVAYHYKDNAWQAIPGLVLPRGTVVYAQIIPASKSRRPIFNIIDAHSLGGRSLATFDYATRLQECSEFIASELTPANADYCVTCATEFKMRSLSDILEELVRNKGKFNTRYFKTPLSVPSTTKSTSAVPNMDVGEIVFFQTKTKFDGVLAFAGWRVADFGRLVCEEVSWAWLPSLQIKDREISDLINLVNGEQCFPVFQHLHGLGNTR